jgi:hypothetical protein
MQSKDLRSILSRGASFVRSTNHRTSRPLQLATRVGKALGIATAATDIERLEERRLLDGSFDNPLLLPNPNPQGVIIQAGDINPAVPGTNNDTYRFTSPTSGFLSVLADTANQVSSLNTQVQVFNNARQLIASGTNNGILTSGTTRDGWAGFIATAGEQYFVVVSSEGISAGSYTLRVRTANQTFDMGGEQPSELGVGRELGSPVPDLGATPPVPPAAILGQLGGTGPIANRERQDELVYRWTVPAGSAYNSLTTINAQSTVTNVQRRLDTRIDVYNAQGVLVTSDSDTGRINDGFAVLRTNPGQTYFIRVRSDEILNNNIELATGAFFLVIDASAQNLAIDDMTRRGTDGAGTFLGFGDPSVAPNPAAPNPVFQTASYSFVAQGSGLSIIVARPRGLAPVSDPALRLYDDAGTLIDFRDNTVGLVPQLSVNLEGGRRYFVVVDGFAVQSRTQFSLFVEANHTFQTGVIDDHINTPAGPANADLRRRANLATALPWDDTPSVLVDTQDGQLAGTGTTVPAAQALQSGLRIERDRGMRYLSSGEGRIEAGTDNDLFTFTAPVDMLNTHTGNNDDAGTSLFVGGSFDSGNPNSTFDVFSQGLVTFDADDYWPVGPQFATDEVDWGFADNPTTPGVVGSRIHAIRAFTMNTGTGPRSFLWVGGDFRLTLPDANGQPLVIDNLAVWAFNVQQARYEWQEFGGADGPVFAFKDWEITPAGGGQATDFLFIGGDYTRLFTVGGFPGGLVAGSLGFITEDFGIGAAGDGVNGAVRALEVYEPFEPVVSAPGQPVTLQGRGERLYVGGSFTNVGPRGTPASNANRGMVMLLDDLDTFERIGNDPAAPAVNGSVFALQRHTPADASGSGADRLIVGGQFTAIDGAPMTNLASYFNQFDSPDANFPELGGALPFGGAGLNGPVFALTVWDIPNINNVPDSEPLFQPKIVIGGQFAIAGINNLILGDLDEDSFSDFFAPPVWQGSDAPVRALTTLVDAQEPGVHDDQLISGSPQQVLYIGGEFTEITTADGIVAATGVAQLSAFNFGQTDLFAINPLDGSVGNRAGNNADVGVFALGAYDDGNAARWDRHDRPRTRVSMTINPSFGSFINARVRVYDSNFNIVYSLQQTGSDTISPLFPDPAGTIDFSLSGGGTTINAQTEGFEVWGGETYYVEVSNLVGNQDATAQPSGATGRYTISIAVDSGPVDINGDGVRDEVNLTSSSETANEGRPIQATQVLTTLATGEGSGTRNTAAGFPWPGNDVRAYRVNPSTNLSYSLRSDEGTIDSIDDTDLYFFRAEETGFTELRVQTIGILGQFAEVYGNTTNVDTKNINSRLDAAIRVFNNDLEQIGYVDNVTTVGGDPFQYVGSFAGAPRFEEFRRQDPRIVIPVVAGQVYFFQVESGQRWVNPEAPLPPDAGDPENPLRRVPSPVNEREWRDATGKYAVLVNQVGQLATDFENGVFTKDDYPDISGQGTVVPFDAQARSTFAGVINDTPTKPNDVDFSQLLLPASGRYTITIRVTSGDLIVAAGLFEIGGDQVANLTSTGEGVYSATFDGAAGDLLQLVVSGSGTTQGGYTVDMRGPTTAADDFADANKWYLATELRPSDFRGRIEASGAIQSLYDTDVFKFDFDAFQRATFTVRSLDLTFVPRVTVYEVTETGFGEVVFLRIGTGVGTRNAQGQVLPAAALASLQPERVVEVPAPGENRPYPFYYVVVEGAVQEQDFGRYELEVSYAPTDDHADGDTDLDGTFDTGEFAFATEVPIDSIEGTGTQAGNLELQTDSDLFSFIATGTGVSTITLNRAVGSSVRARLSVLNASGAVLATASMADSNVATLALNLNVTRGQELFLVVDSIGPNTQTTRTGAYTLAFVSPVADDHPNALEWDIATPITLNPATGRGGIGEALEGAAGNPRITPDTDTDLFRFTTILAGDQQITVTPVTSILGNIAVRLQVFISTNLTTPLATVDATAINTPVTFTVAGAAANATYFVLVSPLSGVAGSSARGEYAIAVAGPRPDDPVDPTDPSEVDFDNPTRIVLSERTGVGSSVGNVVNGQNSEISPANDRDLYSFVAAGTGRVFVRVWLPQGSLLDAAITVFRRNDNGTRTQVAFDADGISGSTAYTTFGARAGETYLVLVDGLGEATGSYVVEVQAATQVNRLVYPEGFTSNTVFEYVPIVNPNPFPIEYTVRLRYETGTFETVFATRTIAANARDGVAINQGTQREPNVIAGVGYSILIDWTVPDFNPISGFAIDPASVQPLGATLSHYDFGSSTGDAFTSTVSPSWTFARVERNPGAVLDFLLYYNPQSYPVATTLRAFFADGSSVALAPRIVEGGRRGGFSINDLQELGRGVFGVTLTSQPADTVLPANLLVEPFEGIVASLTHYAISSTNTSAFAVLGDATGGARAGAVNRFEQGSGISSEITFFNPGISNATVTLTGAYQRANLPEFSRTIDVGPGRTVRLTGAQLGLLSNQPIGLRYTSTNNIAVISQTATLGDADAATQITSAGTRFLFGDAYINANTAGRNFFETLSFYNPTNVANTVSVNLFFFNRADQPELGNANPARRTITVNLPARGFGELKLHEAAEVITNRGPGNSPDIWFGIETVAAQPFTVSMTHYDLVLGGGWGAAGVPVGLTTPLTQITFN